MLATSGAYHEPVPLSESWKGKEETQGVSHADGHGQNDEPGLGIAENAEGTGEEEGMPGRHYKRGLAPYVFVPWEHIQDSPLNLPIAKMDFYVPG